MAYLRCEIRGQNTSADQCTLRWHWPTGSFETRANWLHSQGTYYWWSARVSFYFNNTRQRFKYVNTHEYECSCQHRYSHFRSQLADAHTHVYMCELPRDAHSTCSIYLLTHKSTASRPLNWRLSRSWVMKRTVKTSESIKGALTLQTHEAKQRICFGDFFRSANCEHALFSSSEGHGIRRQDDIPSTCQGSHISVAAYSLAAIKITNSYTHQIYLQLKLIS
jgi:hypothetical protein